MFNAFTPRSASAYQRINVETSMHTIDQYQLVNCWLKMFMLECLVPKWSF